MDNFLKLKAIAILVCSGIAGNVVADTTTTNSATSTSSTVSVEQGTKLSDETINSNVNSALSDYSGKISITVKSGVVYLAGELPSDTDYDKIITTAESSKGVSDVNVDKLTVKDSASPLSDTYITAKVKGALIQSELLGENIPSWPIHVETKDGQVYLSGTIATQQEKQNVLTIVKAVSGVKAVNDKIEVAVKNDTMGAAPTNTTTQAAADTISTKDSTDKEGSDSENDDEDDNSDE